MTAIATPSYVRAAGLVVGDVVGVLPGGGGEFGPDTREVTLVTVQRTTATQVVMDDGSRWTHADRLLGARRHVSPRLVSAESARSLNVERAALRERLRMVREAQDTIWRQVPTETLAQIVTLLRAAKVEGRS